VPFLIWGLWAQKNIERQGNIHLHSDDWQRTIYIDSIGVGTTDFNLSDDMKKKLEDSGRKGAGAYFEWFDKPESKPANRP
jgi:NTE family protein